MDRDEFMNACTNFKKFSNEPNACNDEKVDHPSHYAGAGGLEAIDVISAFTADLQGLIAFDIGNAIKYICRFSKKNGTEDLKKAIWYLNDAINNYSEKEN